MLVEYLLLNEYCFCSFISELTTKIVNREKDEYEKARKSEREKEHVV